MQYYEKIKNAVREADRVLVGLGEEWVLTDEAIYNAVEDSHPVFTALLKFAATQEQYRDIVPYLEAFYYNQITEIPDMWKDAYAHLRRLLEGKDYYIVSLTIDPYLSQMGFDMDRCVNPCGSVQRMQCRNGCTEELYIAKSIMQVFSEKLRQKMQDVSETELQESVLTDLVNDCREEIAKLICPKCGAPLFFNTLEATRYREEGYLGNWQMYMKWLQGSVNKKLCVIEAGAGMSLQSVIRWPFEKTVYYNQKSSLYRIHHTFHQVNHEIAERSCGIEASAVSFFKDMKDGEAVL